MVTSSNVDNLHIIFIIPTYLILDKLFSLLLSMAYLRLKKNWNIQINAYKFNNIFDYLILCLKKSFNDMNHF